MFKVSLLILFLNFAAASASAKNFADTLDLPAIRIQPGLNPLLAPGNKNGDTVKQRAVNPRKATILSAIVPGLGQAYNGKCWKIPLVYAGIGIPAHFFFDNKRWYRRTQYALTVAVNNSPPDSLARVDRSLLPFVQHHDINGLISNRDEYRKDQDYSVLFFLLFYGLQIMDATVDAHLKGFSVGDDLTLRISPTLLASATVVAGISLVFEFHKPRLPQFRTK